MRLSPYPCVLTIRITDRIPVSALGLTESEQGRITVKIRPCATDNVLVHEAVHVAQAVEDYIDGKLDSESEAYLVEFVFNKLQTVKEKYELHSSKTCSKNSK